ncbi:MAG: DUF1223 domain-containing protein, partial [Xanthobacteraceae bacterium]
HVIAQTDRNPAIMSLPVRLAAAHGVLTVTVKAAPGQNNSGEVWLCPLLTAVAVSIGRGENDGRTITYHNVVRAWDKLGEFTGTDSTWSVPLTQIDSGNIDAAAVFVQEGTRAKPGIVLGAALIPLAQKITDDRPGTTSR